MSADNGLIKQKRLPENMDNLSERLPVNGRYYLKNNHSTEALVPDSLAPELSRDARIQFLQLGDAEICRQLTLRDFEIFKSIQSTEYVDHIFKLKSLYGTAQLEKFIKLPNQERFWTISEIIREQNLIQRAKVIKHFIKIASWFLLRREKQNETKFYENFLFRMLQRNEEFQFDVRHCQRPRSQSDSAITNKLGKSPGKI